MRYRSIWTNIPKTCSVGSLPWLNREVFLHQISLASFTGPLKPPAATMPAWDCYSTVETAVASADCRIGFCRSAIFQHMIHSNTELNLFVTRSLSQPHCSYCLVWPWNHFSVQGCCLAFCLVAHFEEACRWMRLWLTGKNKRVGSILVFLRGECTHSLFCVYLAA